MHSSGSVLYTILDRVKRFADIDDGARFPDSYIINELVTSEWANILQNLRMGDEHPIVLLWSMPVVEQQQRYILPPIIAEVLRVGEVDQYGNVLYDWVPRTFWNAYGCNWRVEANELTAEPIPQESNSDVLVWYVPSGDVLVHMGTGTVVDDTTIELAATPTLGQLDQREQAYAGCILRVFQSGTRVQERIIQSYDTVTRRAVVRMPFSQGSGLLPADGQTVTYEVLPHLYSSVLLNAVAAVTAMQMAPAEGFSQKKLASLEFNYQRSMKTLHDMWCNKVVRVAKGLEQFTLDNPVVGDTRNLTLWGLRF